MRLLSGWIWGVLLLASARPGGAVCTNDAYEPDNQATAAAGVIRGGETQNRNFCGDATDWVALNVCAGRSFTLALSNPGPSARTLIEVFDGDALQLVATNDDGDGNLAPTLTWAANRSSTHHVRFSQQDGSSGDGRDYDITLTGDTSICDRFVRGVEQQPGSFLRYDGIVQATDGGFVAVGIYEPIGSLWDLALTKFTPSGSIDWIRTIGTTGSEVPTGFVRTADGGYLVSGLAVQGGFVLKVNSAGAVMWQRLLGASPNQELSAVVEAPGGGGYAAGFSVSAGSFAGLVIRFDENGAPAWSKLVSGSQSATLAGLAPLANGNLIGVGYSELPSGLGDGLLVQFDPSGNLLSQTTYDQHAVSVDFSRVRVLPGGDLVVGGNYCTGELECRALVARLTPAGAIVWQKTLDFGSYDATPHAIDLLPDGSLLISLQVRRPDSNDELVLTRWGANGDLLFERGLGTIDGGTFGTVALDGGIAAAAGGGMNARFARLDVNGQASECSAILNANGVVATPSMAPASISLSATDAGETGPATEFAVSSTARGVSTLCPCTRVMDGPISVNGKGPTLVAWPDDQFGPYDVVRGDLAALHANGGDFTDALNAVSGSACLANDRLAFVVADPSCCLAPGAGTFYLVRGFDGGGYLCPSTYDDRAAQLGERDAEIAASSTPCP